MQGFLFYSRIIGYNWGMSLGYKQITPSKKQPSTAGASITEATRRELAMILAEESDHDRMDRLLGELFTHAEIRTLVQRWRLLKKLKDGVTQRNIARQLRASLCKITRGSRVLKQPDSIVAEILKDRERFLCE